MKVTHRRGRVVLHLQRAETALLDVLLDQLAEVLADEQAHDEVSARLFPSAYPDDADAEAEYRSITESGLRSDRLERTERCGADLAVGSELDLSDEEDGRRWIQVLNDLRLTLGTRLGVTEEPPDLDISDPATTEWTVYFWLTAVQDSIVTALTGR